MKKRTFLAVLGAILALLIVGCSGGSDNGGGGVDENVVGNVPISLSTLEETPVKYTLDKIPEEEGQSVVGNVKTSPQHGSVTDEDGVITYTPNDNYVGTDSFVYDVTATTAGNNETPGGNEVPVENTPTRKIYRYSFAITVGALNEGPQITGTAPTIANVGNRYSFTPTVQDDASPTGTLSVTGSGVPSWASLNASTGELSGTPSIKDIGVYENITLSVTDGEFTNSLEPFTITVDEGHGNTPPTISGSPSTFAEAGKAYSFTPTAHDADDDPLTFSVANKPTWATFSSSTGALKGSPASSDKNTTFPMITISVDDGSGGNAALDAFDIFVKE